LASRNTGVKRVEFAAALKAETTRREHLVLPYVRDLRNVVDIDAIRVAGLELVSIRWAAPPFITGSRSAPPTSWISPSSIRTST
jgi:hypothetical protein